MLLYQELLLFYSPIWKSRQQCFFFFSNQALVIPRSSLGTHDQKCNINKNEATYSILIINCFRAKPTEMPPTWRQTFVKCVLLRKLFSHQCSTSQGVRGGYLQTALSQKDPSPDLRNYPEQPEAQVLLCVDSLLHSSECHLISCSSRLIAIKDELNGLERAWLSVFLTCSVNTLSHGSVLSKPTALPQRKWHHVRLTTFACYLI